jgi:hypothetical protein
VTNGTQDISDGGNRDPLVADAGEIADVKPPRRPRVKKAKPSKVTYLADYSPVSNRGSNQAGIVTGENSPAGIITGEKSKRKRGRPRKADDAKPYAPEHYEWRGDSGGWKLIHRPPRGNNRRGYGYVGFLNHKRWEFLRRFDDEKFIKFVTRFFEQRKRAGQSRSLRAG